MRLRRVVSALSVGRETGGASSTHELWALRAGGAQYAASKAGDLAGAHPRSRQPEERPERDCQREARDVAARSE